MDNLNSLTVSELKERLKENRLLVTGTKQTLVERLMGIVFAPAGAPITADDDVNVSDEPGEHVDDDDDAAHYSDVCDGATGGFSRQKELHDMLKSAMDVQQTALQAQLDAFRREMFDMVRGALILTQTNRSPQNTAPPATPPHSASAQMQPLAPTQTYTSQSQTAQEHPPVATQTQPSPTQMAQLQQPIATQMQPSPTAMAQLEPPFTTQVQTSNTQMAQLQPSPTSMAQFEPPVTTQVQTSHAQVAQPQQPTPLQEPPAPQAMLPAQSFP